MLAPLGAFGSAAPVALRRGCKRVGYFCRFLQTPDPPADPALPADGHPSDPRALGSDPASPPLSPKSSSFDQLFADRKCITNQTPRKASPTLQNPTLGRQMSDFQWILGAFVDPFSIKFACIFEKRRKPDSIEKPMKVIDFAPPEAIIF